VTGVQTCALPIYQVFNSTSGFGQSGSNACKIQTRFTGYIKHKYPWLFERPSRYGFSDFAVPFGSGYKDVIRASCEFTLRHLFPPKNPWSLLDELVLTSYLHDVIVLSWGMFFTELWDNPRVSNSITECNKQYEEFVRELHVWLSKDARSSLDLLKSLHSQSTRCFFNEVDWTRVAIQVVIGAAGAAALVLTGGAAALVIPVTLAALEGSMSIYDQAKANGGKVDWRQVGLRAVGGAASGAIWMSPLGPVAQVLAGAALEAGVTFGEGMLERIPIGENVKNSLRAGVTDLVFEGVSTGVGCRLQKTCGMAFREKVATFVRGIDIPPNIAALGFKHPNALRGLVRAAQMNAVEVDEAVLDLIVTEGIEYVGRQMIEDNQDE
jgi:hypothetical protein